MPQYKSRVAPPRPTAEPQTPLEILQQTAGKYSNVPMLPNAAHRALAVANDANSSLRAFARVIEQDNVLATGILSLANSALYCNGRHISNLTQAVVRLGLTECQSLIIAVGMRTLYYRSNHTRRHHFERLWQHAFVTGSVSRRISETLHLDQAGDEFAGGLLHDLGRTLIALGVPHLIDQADPLDFKDDEDRLLKEQEVLGTDHCQFGAWFANINGLPANLTEVILHHHHPALATHAPVLVSIVAAADHMSNYLERTDDAEGYDFHGNLGWELLSRPWSVDLRSRYEQVLIRRMKEALREAKDVLLASGL